MNNRFLRQTLFALTNSGLKTIAIVCLLVGLSSTEPFLINTPAQNYGRPITVSGVSISTSQKRTVVAIQADAPLDAAQTWQDNDGFHVVVLNASIGGGVRSTKGVKVRRLGGAVEIVVQARPGTNVSVEQSTNQLSLLVEGKLDIRMEAEQPRDDIQLSQSESSYYQTPVTPYPSYPQNTNPLPYQPSFTPRNAGDTGLPTVGRNGFVEPQTNGVTDPSGNPGLSASDGLPPAIEDEESLLASVFSGTSVLIVVALGLIGLLISRKLNASSSHEVDSAGDQNGIDLIERFSPTSANGNGAESTSLVRTGSRDVARERKAVVRLPVSTPASLFGAYRIDQEVGKLVLGQAHRMDVLSSRAPDDRRAIETSLVKTISSPEADETSRRRAREALEEYGFVARECAALLLAPDAFERTSAARSLGEIKSPLALPFLLEGLYDHESIVRNQAVVSIGELKIPAAIGALLDMARRHPDVPSSLVSRALSACSVEGLDFFDAVIPEPGLLSAGEINPLIAEITRLEPATPVEALPETSSDDSCLEALTKVESADLEERGEAIKALAQHEVQVSVDVLSAIVRNDPEPGMRALAIGSLAAIAHESVFPAILIGMADETREVRAAAARAMSRLNFDRADAYTRVMESAGDELLGEVASACLRSGIVSQNLDRLSSIDRRQVYEAFSLISLLAKAGMFEAIIDAISSHESVDVRSMAIHLLAATGEPAVFERFKELAVNEDLPEDVKTALLEALYKQEQSKPKDDEAAPEIFWVDSESDIETVNEESAGEPVQPTAIDPEFETHSFSDQHALLDERDF